MRLLPSYTKYILTAFIALLINSPAYTAGPSDEESEPESWKPAVMEELDSKAYEKAFKLLLSVETDNADTSADWNNLMGYTLRMFDEPDLEASEEHYIKAVELEADHKGALEYYGELKLKQNDLEGAKVLLARLTEVCPEGCDELDTLQSAIDSYKDK